MVGRDRLSKLIFTMRLGIKVLALLALAGNAAASEWLPSWTEGSSKQAIIDFVAQVTDQDSPGFVLAAGRGSLWHST